MATDYFPEPSAPARPGGIYLYSHDHDLTLIGARLTPSGVYYSVWACSLCPDILSGDAIGPIPPGWCPRCRWVQKKKWPRKRCEECKYEFPRGGTHEA